MCNSKDEFKNIIGKKPQNCFLFLLLEKTKNYIYFALVVVIFN